MNGRCPLNRHRAALNRRSSRLKRIFFEVPNWSVRAEYRYTDFGTFADTPFADVGAALTAQHQWTQNQVQVGFSYKFDSSAPYPVVAKY